MLPNIVFFDIILQFFRFSKNILYDLYIYISVNLRWFLNCEFHDGGSKMVILMTSYNVKADKISFRCEQV